MAGPPDGVGQWLSVPPEMVEGVAVMAAPSSAVPFSVATTSIPGIVKLAVVELPGVRFTATPSVDEPSGSLSGPQSPLTTL